LTVSTSPSEGPELNIFQPGAGHFQGANGEL
jgi:hypothetical protein